MNEDGQLESKFIYNDEEGVVYGGTRPLRKQRQRSSGDKTDTAPEGCHSSALGDADCK